MLCVFHGHYGKADLYLRSLIMKASVEYRIASCIFRNKFSLVGDMHIIIYHTTKCDISVYNFFFSSGVTLLHCCTLMFSFCVP